MKIPRHIAIILDGNRRYARKRRLQPWKGHEAGARKISELIDWAIELGIKEVTLYIFSTENFNRSKREKDFLFGLFREQFKKLKGSKRVNEKDIRVNVIGKLDRFPKDMQKSVMEIIEKTKNKKGLVMNFAMGYGGRAEIVEAVRDIVKKKVPVGRINENLIKSCLCLKNDPEIVIRPGGEVRTSNFLMWQSAYSEWFFTKKLWPEFSKKDLLKIIKEFNARERRFGK